MKGFLTIGMAPMTRKRAMEVPKCKNTINPPTKSNQRPAVAVKPLTAKGLAMDLGAEVKHVRAILRARYRGEGTDERWFPWLWRNKREIEAVRRYVMRVLGRSTERRKNDGALHEN